MLAEKLRNLSARQVNSQYEIVFVQGIPFGTNTTGEEVKLMQRGDFTHPSEESGTTEWFYRGVKTVDVVGVDETDKRFTLIFEVDQQWRIYKDFKAWKDAVYDSKTGVIGDRKEVSTEIIANALGSDDRIYFSWKYIGVRAVALEIDPFDHEGGAYSRITVTCIYDYWDEV